jgi:transcriptional regulator with XRE-family HTH domain
MSKAQLAFGSVLRRLRLDAGVTLGDLARLLIVSIPYLSDVETGRRPPLSNERIESAGRFIAKKAAEKTGEANPADTITKLYRAAATTSGVFELKAGGTRARQVGAQLARLWSNLSDEGLGEIERVLRREGDKNDRDDD